MHHLMKNSASQTVHIIDSVTLRASLQYDFSAFQGIGRYPCSHPGCGAVLNFEKNYHQHMKRHLGIYPYHCPYCNKGLSATGQMKYHLKSQHTGLMGFHCNKCRQEFRHVRQLKFHLEQNNCTSHNHDT